MKTKPRVLARTLGALSLGVALSGAPFWGVPAAWADHIRNPIGVFAGLDKITGRIIAFEVAIDETVQFGSLQITPRTCLTRPQTETPLTEGFVEVDEIETSKQSKRIFSGWMFAASPGLHGVEHPVYDVWLTDCKGGVDVTASPVNAPANPNAPPPANAAPAPRDSAQANKPRRTIEPQNPVDPTLSAKPAEAAPDAGAPVDINPPLPNSAPSTDLDSGHAAPVGPAATSGDGSGLGAPIDVGPPPGAPKKPKRKPKPKPVAPQDPFGEPDPVPPGSIPNTGNY